MPRSRGSLAVAGTLLVGVLALTAQPALAAGTSPDAGAPAGAPASLQLHTIPAVGGVRLNLDGRAFQTDRHGFVAITTTSGTHHISIAPPPAQPGRTVSFSRWLDGIALTQRDITLSPGVNREQAGMVVSHPIAVRFTGPNGRPVPLSDVTRVTVDSSLGERFTFAPGHPPHALAVNRIVRNQSGLAPLIIRYSVRSVIIDDSNVVYGGSQNFHVQPSGAWTVAVLLFPLRVEVRDALFGFGIGSAVRLKLPGGSSRIIELGPGHATTLAELPRATYQLAARGPGFGLTSPATLSKPQVAKLLLLSWIDILAVVAFAVLFAVGLPLLGGRIIRHPGRPKRPAWQRARPHGPPTPASAGTGETTAADAGEADGNSSPAVAAADTDTTQLPAAAAEDADRAPSPAAEDADTIQLPAVVGEISHTGRTP
jgi:hypothetical protein